MNPARFTVKRPVFTLMATLIVIIIGLTAFVRLPVDLMPDISYPTLSISTTYQNASPEVIEQLITRPLEEAMSAVPGIEEISSVSREGSSRVLLSFAWGSIQRTFQSWLSVSPVHSTSFLSVVLWMSRLSTAWSAFLA
jgi:HAE1 family hydrophobic/amphiphilic exporter-1